ncbi:MAG: hypothetical protein FJW30_04325 [Acidobacteria bacterium]|nr:hypothetical protein [Acidobacteriota bacterium]
MYARAVGAVLIVAAVSLASTGRLFTQVADFYTQAPVVDGVTEFTGRLAQLKAMLPASGVAGYMTDPGTPATDTNAQAEYHLVQYALAPVLVVYSTEQRYVIGNFHNRISTGSLREQGFELVREFGNGIALFENAKAK